MKDITLKITGKQIYDTGEHDQIEFVTEGQLYKKPGAFYIMYEESELSGMPGCKTRLKVAGDYVSMKRIGLDETEGTTIEFEKGKRHVGLYDTPYGPVEMEVLTNLVKHALDEEGLGAIDVDYSMSLRGLSESHNTLSIEVRSAHEN